ncbi:hypothetical protein [Atlantibacter hermannii]|uniref:hypothetical protein n=1 Tax=Atlantibacter hermannii TaxID=565 RepID=UPI0028A85D0F|nr:hypothetical protein [Atlantibacter hermannii]
MRKFSKATDSTINKKIELMIKTINRTDSYLNSANTKSTILLSLSSALIAAIAINSDKILQFVHNADDKAFLVILMVLIIFLLIGSLLFSLNGITPYIKKSESANTFSFVDVAKNYSQLDDYRSQFNSTSSKVLLNQLMGLNHNLSKALVVKYERQILAITCLEAAAYLLGFSIYVIILANS